MPTPEPEYPTSSLPEQLRIEIADIVSAYVKDHFHDHATLVNRIHASLDAELEAIIGRLLGFEVDPFNRSKPLQWEVDHCNGRAGESAAGTYIREKARAAVQTWLDNLISSDKLLAIPTPSFEAALFAEYKKVFERSVLEEVRCRAQRSAASYVEALALTDLGQFLTPKDR